MRELAKELPQVILNSRADSTVKSYSGAFNKMVEMGQKA